MLVMSTIAFDAFIIAQLKKISMVKKCHGMHLDKSRKSIVKANFQEYDGNIQTGIKHKMFLKDEKL